MEAIIAALIALVALFCYITDKLIGWHYDRREAKRRRTHLELYKLFNAVNEKTSEGIHWRNTKRRSGLITSSKNRITYDIEWVKKWG